MKHVFILIVLVSCLGHGSAFAQQQTKTTSDGKKAYKELIEQYEATLKRQEAAYQDLKNSYDSVLTISIEKSKQRTSQLQTFQTGMTELKLEITKAEKEVELAKNALKMERRRSRRGYWFWGFVGFGLGYVVAVIAR